MNFYEAGTQKIIPAVLLYATYRDQTLMMFRDQKKNDIHQNKWNGLGGKIESGETPEEAATREFFEEAACHTQAQQWKWAGQLFFPNFKPQKHEDWWVTVFTTRLTLRQFKQISESPFGEGTLKWVKTNKLLTLNLWEGDRKFIPLLIKKKPFHGTFFYKNGKLSQFSCKPIR